MLWTTSLLALDVNGISYISLSQYAKMTGMNYNTLVRGKKMNVFSKYNRLSFEVHSRAVRVNGYFVNLGHPVAVSKGMLYLSKRDAYKTLAPILSPTHLKNPRVPFRVVIDAGHGGRDKGAENKYYGIKEKDVNLDIALRLGRALQQMGYKVSYTRTKDVFIDLEHRPVIANRRGADLFISIHSNAAVNKGVSGVETYALTPTWLPSSSSTKLRKSDTESYAGNNVDGWSQLLSYSIQRSLVDTTDSDDRGARRARFAVLRTATMPACLVEVGFISNKAECSKLANKSYRQNVANAIARGVARYASIVRRCKR